MAFSGIADLRRLLPLLASVLLVACTPIIPPREAAPPPPRGPADEIPLFLNVSARAGIDAEHAATWNQFGEEGKEAPFDTGYMAMGQAWGDFDNDGWPDLYVTGNQAPNALFRNRGDGTFERSAFDGQTALPDVESGGAMWVDFDNDGWKDLYVLVHGPNVLFRNLEGQGFADVAVAAGVDDPGKGEGAAWADFDRDGFLDLYVVNWSCWPDCDPIDPVLAQDALFRNRGDGTFEPASHLLVPELLRGAGFAASFLDFDGDGDSDLYVVNDRMQNPVGNVLWRNDGPGCGGWCWTNASRDTNSFLMIHGMGLAVGDYDNDLDLDMYFSDMVNPMILLANEEGQTFANRSRTAGVGVGPSPATGWGTAFLDYNNDGWQDLYLATTEFRQETAELGPEGMFLAWPDTLFRNEGDGTFADVTPTAWTEEPWPALGFAHADFDRDGWIDYVVGEWRRGYVLYRNQAVEGRGHRWLTVRLEGRGAVNRDAVGARVLIETDGDLRMMQEVKIGSSLGSGNDTALHFGFGPFRVPEAITVQWPDGSVQRFEDDLPLNAEVLIRHGEQPVDITPATGAAGLDPFADVTAAVGLDARHEGFWDMFNPDFASGYLGVGQAWGDFDNDGWLDLFFTGNIADNVLFRNDGGVFSRSDLTADVAMPGELTGGAVFADYDNDGWSDLYVIAQGPNRLFRNREGSGFEDVTAAAGVGDTGKGSGAAWGDFDGDALLDLYVTNWSCYPECEETDHELAADRLYRNRGDGTFEDVSGLLVHAKRLGAGFAVTFLDFDNDGDSDIYVVNDELHNPIGNVLWRNDGPGCDGWCWHDASEETGANVRLAGMGIAAGDLDNDQDLDLYFSNMVNAMALLENRGGEFVSRARQAGVAVGPSPAVGWGTAFLDIDNDGWLDLHLATTKFVQETAAAGPEGMHDPYPDILFHNEGNGRFIEVTPTSWERNGRPTMGSAYADYDRDGFVDVVATRWNEGLQLYRNTGLWGGDNRSLTVRLEGDGLHVNRDAAGARVYLTRDDGQVLMREVKLGSSLGAGNDTAVRFGLGRSRITSLEIAWPDGTRQSIEPPESPFLVVAYKRQ